ncbi:MAG: DNA translocase FtsK 4TM domain-containing protein [Desulfobacterales bacterium]|jgi:S-DNA-T family DNA segregation ATPase FtsK/SpoIIIE|nr:DNA translocase FtsK 4TM domain-containing protein [Desulfobacterales bacterium]
MRKELVGLLLFFLVIFTLISLLSFTPVDPSINNATADHQVHNLFGKLGAYSADILISLFGIGAFWIPVILMLASIHLLSKHPRKSILLTVIGGIVLAVTTGSLLALQKDHYVIFNTKISSGGLIGIPLKSLLIHYANPTGGFFILILVWIAGFILATGFSIHAFALRCHRHYSLSLLLLKDILIKWKVRREKKRHQKQVKKNPTKEKEIQIHITAPPPPSPATKKIPKPKQEVFSFMREDNGFQLPSTDFLVDPEPQAIETNRENLEMQSRLVEKKLEDFGVLGKVVAVIPGPVITTFEYEPAPGVKINKIVNLTDDLALALRAMSIRIVAPIPGKSVIGIEIPNANRQMVRFKEVLVSEAFDSSKSFLTLCLGKDIVGNPVAAELDKMPHLLIAGATGAGKSVALNTMICSFLYKATPDEVKFIMVDPKRIELSTYDGIPHLITPVVTDVKKATNALFWAVREMENRYKLLSEKKARNILQYNQKIDKDKKAGKEDVPNKLPYIVIIIDELADLMMVASRDVEVSLMRLAQMARAAGLHLILATQRPSVDVLTGIIKANFPTRLTFQVSSKTDSRTIIDCNGAEHLLGMGDMLFLPPGTAKLQRIHGAYLSEEEISRITEFLKSQAAPSYDQEVTEARQEDATGNEEIEFDEKYDEAVALVTKTRQASISMIQRHLRIGYNRAARIIEVMEKEGVVGPSDGVKQREVLVPGYES